MLVLSRQRNEEIILSDQATGAVIGRIVLVDIRGDKVRMGFELPSNIIVHRKEVQDAINAEKMVAAMERADHPAVG